jgi:hypothetical protein
MSASDRLDLGAFERLLDVHGASLERWPEELRSRAQDFLASSEPARTAWNEARRLDGLLNAMPDVLPSADLLARIASLPARHPRSSSWWPFGNALAPFLAWGAAVALGLFVGSVAVPDLDNVEPDAVQEIGAGPANLTGAEAVPSDDWSELSELAWGDVFALEDDQ